MAHPGAAKTMLNIFRHRRTPGNYVPALKLPQFAITSAADVSMRARLGVVAGMAVLVCIALL